MTIINLNDKFLPYGDGIKFSKFNFPSGIEQHIKIHNMDEIDLSHVMITNKINSTNDIFDILLTVNILRNYKVEKISLNIPYIPYGRQDRITSKNEAFSLKVFGDLINSQNFYKVITYDTHSDVSASEINNLTIIKNHVMVNSILENKENFHIICPDAGAHKKIYSLCEYLNYNNEIIMCNKVRDISNGNIKYIQVYTDDLKGKDCYIVDDICSRGGTFMLTAKELKKKNCGKIYLIVSHYEGSADIIDLHTSGIEKIYTTNSIINADFSGDYINIFTLNNKYYTFK